MKKFAFWAVLSTIVYIAFFALTSTAPPPPSLFGTAFFISGYIIPSMIIATIIERISKAAFTDFMLYTAFINAVLIFILAYIFISYEAQFTPIWELRGSALTGLFLITTGFTAFQMVSGALYWVICLRNRPEDAPTPAIIPAIYGLAIFSACLAFNSRVLFIIFPCLLMMIFMRYKNKTSLKHMVIMPTAGLTIITAITYGIYQFLIYPDALTEYNEIMNKPRPACGCFINDACMPPLISEPINGNDYILPVMLVIYVHTALSLLYWCVFLKPKTQSASAS